MRKYIEKIFETPYVIKLSDVKNISTSDTTEAIRSGATSVMLFSDGFHFKDFHDLQNTRTLCRTNSVPFIVVDNILLASALEADGIHFDSGFEELAYAKDVIGSQAIIGITIKSIENLMHNIPCHCDYALVDSVLTAPQQEMIAKNLAEIPLINLNYNFKPVNSGISHSVISPWEDEFKLIANILEEIPIKDSTGSSIKINAGDDASLLKSLKNPVISTDTHREGVHFRLSWQSPEEVGFKAVTAALSDLAASYAKPKVLFINLSIPDYLPEITVRKIYSGVGSALSKYDCELGGGNISSGNQLSLDLFVIGEGSNVYPLRSNALPGHLLCSTGPLGNSRAGLQILQKSESDIYPELVRSFKSPTARFDAALILQKNGINCVLDISDGLSGDAEHIARASGVTIQFDLNKRVFSDSLLWYCEMKNINHEDFSLKGGEDYELLFTCSESAFEALKSEIPEVCKVGVCIPYTGNFTENLPEGISSYRHG